MLTKSNERGKLTAKNTELLESLRLLVEQQRAVKNLYRAVRESRI
jgi:hypothetical protein